MKRGLLSLVLLLTLAPASAKVRIMLISDPHVMGPGLLINKGEAFDNTNRLDRKLNDYSSAIYDEIIAIALKEKPDLFLISGDLTKDGELLSHQYVVKKLYELKEAGIRVFVVPGNHDMGTTNAYYYDGSLIRAAETINTSQFAEMYKDFGYGEDIEQEPTTLTWCCEPFDGLVLIGIDTGHDGTFLNGVISHATYEWVQQRAKSATAAGKQVVVMMHHALFPHVTNAEKVSSTYAVKLGMPNGDGSYAYYSYSTLRNHLADAGVGVVLTGHVHALDIAKDANKDLTRTIHDISTATCAAYPNPYRLLTLNDNHTMSIRTHYITELPGVEDFQALAKERMITSLKNLGLLYTGNEDAAALLAEMFLLYVCGNEAENPRSQELLDAYEERLPALKADEKIQIFLSAYGVTFDEMETMVYSLLKDKSNYGDPERESLDDDLNTTIPVSEDGWTAIRRVEVGERRPDTGWYTLQGVKVLKPSQKGIYIRNGKLSVVK
jgi:3',5'-cyclic AMP phosphodiesterase CpdA